MVSKRPCISNDVRLFMYVQTAVETTAKVGDCVVAQKDYKVTDLLPAFIRHVRFEWSLSPNTAIKYEQCLRSVTKDLGNLSVKDISLGHLTELKQKVITRGAGEARVGSMVFAIKSLLKFCQEAMELDVLDYKKIKKAF